MIRRRGAAVGDRGGMSLNLAVILPLMLALVLTAVQGCLWWYAREAALTAAREGVEHGRVGGSGGTGAAGPYARASAERLAGDLLRGVSASTEGSSPEQVRVTVSGRSLSVVPFLPGITVRQSAVGPVERFTTPRG